MVKRLLRHISTHKLKADAENQRFDSMVISYARVLASLNVENMNLSKHDIKKLHLEIKNAFTSADGNIISLPLESYGLGNQMPIDLKDVHVVLMKDPKQAPSADNLLDTIYMNIHIELQTQNKLILQNNSIFTFGLALDTFNFDAVEASFVFLSASFRVEYSSITKE